MHPTKGKIGDINRNFVLVENSSLIYSAISDGCMTLEGLLIQHVADFID